MNTVILSKYEKALEYEIFVKKEYSFLDNYIKSANLIFDIGWHIWLFSKYCLDINSDLFIYFFEPFNESFNKSKIILDKYIEHIEFINKWVYYKNCTTKLYINNQKYMQNSIYNNNFLVKSQNYINIELIDLSIIINKNISVDLMKLDIEWAEFELLLNINPLVFSYINTICLEYHLINNNSFNWLVDYISNYYRLIFHKESEYSRNLWYLLFSK